MKYASSFGSSAFFRSMTVGTIDEADAFIQKIEDIHGKLDAIVESSELFDESNVARLEELSDLDLTLITEDLSKSNYLGNRKIDIDLALNNNSDTEHVNYSAATFTLNDGTEVSIPFLNESDGVLELSSYADIKQYISLHEDYIANINDTEFTVIDAIGDEPAIMRIKDADGSSSNVDRLEITAYSGSFIESRPAYYWAKTTSSLQTLANRVGDIIALGQDIDKIIALSDKEDEIQYLYDTKTELENLYANIDKVITINLNLDAIQGVLGLTDNINAAVSNEENINAAVANASNISLVAEQASNMSTIIEIKDAIGSAVANEENINSMVLNMSALVEAVDNLNYIKDAVNQASQAAQAATNASTYANESKAYRDELVNLDATAVALLSSEAAYVSYDSSEGLLRIGIPQGLKGEQGEAFTVDSSGTLAEKSSYDNQAKGFAYLDLDNSEVYFKASDTTGDWTSGVPFGKGDDGLSIQDVVKVSGTGAAGTTDTYNIRLSDASVVGSFTVVNGAIPTKADLNLDLVDNTADIDKPVSTATETALGGKADNVHTHVKSDVGLSNVDNTSDAIKNSAVATLTNKTLTSPVINNPTGIVKADVGLGNVDNTADVNKPIATATQEALDLKANADFSNVTTLPDAIVEQLKGEDGVIGVDGADGSPGATFAVSGTTLTITTLE